MRCCQNEWCLIFDGPFSNLFVLAPFEESMVGEEVPEANRFRCG
jgi:hypothetical protein